MEIRKRTNIVFFFFVIFILFSSSYSLAVDELPLLPASYYGSINVNGAPASANTLLTAKIDGATKGSILTSLGEYGKENSIRLSVSGTSEDTGKTVYFCAENKRANEGVEWSSGDFRELDLSFTTLTQGCEASAPDDDTGTGGGGSGGSGGLLPPTLGEDEPAQADEEVIGLPVEEESTIPSTVEEDQEALFEFEASRISSIEIIFNEAVENPSLTIEMSDNKPEGAAEISDNKMVYKYLLINKNFDSSKIKQATISFKVETTWLAQNNAGPGDIVLLHFNEDTYAWKELATRLTGLEGEFYKFEAQISIFSLFAIVASPRKGFDFDAKTIAIIVLVIIIIAFLIMVIVKKKKKGKAKPHLEKAHDITQSKTE